MTTQHAYSGARSGLCRIATFSFAALAVSAVFPTASFAANGDAPIEELIVSTGTRAKPRTQTESAVPIDAFGPIALDQQAHGDMTETLRNLVPSFNATALTGDGSAMVRSTSLRGLPPDEVLVLVNSKRRHRSALVQHLGAAMSAGSQGVDIGMIPTIALQRVEVLRDGASAQYGSDAIAGVLNFIMKDDNEGGQIQAQYGQFYDDENSYKIAGNIGLPFTDNGFVNLSAEYTDNDQLERGFQRENAQEFIDDGIQGVPVPAQVWGRPENSGLRTTWNLGLQLSDSMEFYAFGNYANTTGSYGFFYRAVGQSGTLTPIPIDPLDPSQGNYCWCDDRPGGFTPQLVGDSRDFSQVIGLNGEFANGMGYDFSGSYGSNRLNYTLNNSINLSQGPDGQRSFDTGDLKQHETNLNADFSYPVSDAVNVAFGAEWREETYTMFVADQESWDPGEWASVGLLIDPVTNDFYATPNISASGMAGATPDASGEFSRDNVAGYVDVEWDVTDALLLAAAVRYEDFSDFGGTTNGKFAARWSINDMFTLRGSASTGFRAPTPGQQNYTGIITTFDAANPLIQTQSGTLAPDDPILTPFGGKELDSEEATNYTLGFTANLFDSLSITLDVYRIEVDDRISKTADIPVDASLGLDFTVVSFYTNALNTETDGLDIVAIYDLDWNNGHSTNFTLAYNHNETDVVSQNPVVDPVTGNPITPVSANTIFNIENNLAEDKVSFTIRHAMDKFSAQLRGNYYSDTWNEEVNSNPPAGCDPMVDIFCNKVKISSATIIDLELAYDFNESFTLIGGAMNLLDEYPDKVEARVSQGMPYPRRTPINYHGGMMYLKGVYNF